MMKCKWWVLGIMWVSSWAWSAPQELTFVSTLSSPIGSFKEVVAKDCQVQVTFPSNGGIGEVNIGSSQSSGGSVSIQGKPFWVGTLWMEEDTTFRVGDNSKWIVNEVTLGNYGEIRPLSVHVQTLANDENQNTNLSASNVYMDGNLTTNSAVVSNKLAITRLQFADTKSSATAAFRQLDKTTVENNVGVTPSTKWVITTGSW